MEVEKKYRLTENTMVYRGHTLYRIEALRDFGDVKKGDLGGFIEKEENLSHNGDCWVYNLAYVFENARVLKAAKVLEFARVFGNAIISNYAEVYGDSKICDNAKIGGYSKIHGRANIYGNSQVYDHAEIYGDTRIFDFAQIYGHALIYDNARICGYARIYDNAEIHGHAQVYGSTQIYDHARIFDFAAIYGNMQVSDRVAIRSNVEIYGCFKFSGDAVIQSNSDYVLFKKTWSNCAYFVWTRSNNMWSDGLFYGTGQELIINGLEESTESGKMYESYVKFVESTYLNK